MLSVPSMRRRCGALLLLAAASGARAEATTPVEHVIPAGLESLVLEMTDPGPAGFPGGFKLDGAAIEKSRVKLVYKTGGGKVATVVLAHPGAPGAPVARTARFALLAGEPAPPPPLVEALAARVRAKESRFDWMAVAPPRTGPPGSGPRAESDNGGFPMLPPEASPVERMAPPSYPVPDAARQAQVRQAQALLAAGKRDQAVKEARALAAGASDAPWVVRAAASVLRSAGDGPGAVAVLQSLPQKDMVPLELAAAHELAGHREEAGKALAAVPVGAGEDPACARARALTLLLQEHRAAEVMRASGDVSAGSPRCLILLRMRAAISAGDLAALDAAGALAVARDPKEQDLLYLWGGTYYDRKEFAKALGPWDRLVALNPYYPGILGLYGTAQHVLGRLSGKNLDALVARANAHPDDVIANHLAGIGLYYQKEYARVIPLLERVQKLTASAPEPRAGMYLAMAHFFTGDVETAIRMLDALEPLAHREPDIYYCRSLVWRFYDRNRAIAEMQKFLDVFLSENRPAYGQQKIEKAKDDLVRLKRGETPSVYLPGQGEYTPPPRKKI